MSKIKSLGKSLNKKLNKEKNLIDSASELFQTKGLNETSIDEIVKKAGVAKGTFYLYFKNKFDIFEKIIVKKSLEVIDEAVDHTFEKNLTSFEDRVIEFTDYIIEYFKKNKVLLKLIYKNLSWGICTRAVESSEQHRGMKEILRLFNGIIQKQNISKIEFEQNLFMIIELISSVCYSSIISQEPASIDVMKPALFNMIRKMIK